MIKVRAGGVSAWRGHSSWSQWPSSPCVFLRREKQDLVSLPARPLIPLRRPHPLGLITSRCPHIGN